MNNFFIWIILGIVSIVLGILTSIAVVHKDNRKLYWFFEVWTNSLEYFFAAIIAYFFVDIRGLQIIQSGELSISDFALATIFTFAVIGWWPYVVKNITEGISKIVGTVIKR